MCFLDLLLLLSLFLIFFGGGGCISLVCRAGRLVWVSAVAVSIDKAGLVKEIWRSKRASTLVRSNRLVNIAFAISSEKLIDEGRSSQTALHTVGKMMCGSVFFLWLIHTHTEFYSRFFLTRGRGSPRDVDTLTIIIYCHHVCVTDRTPGRSTSGPGHTEACPHQ